MQRSHTCEIGNLLTAGGAGGDKHFVRLQPSRGGQQPALPNLTRNLEMLARVTEGPGHAAAARIEVDDLRAGNELEQRLRGRQSAHRLLMAVSVEQDARGTGGDR